MDERKATALVLWLGLCQPDYVKKVLINQGLYVFRDGNFYYDAADTEPATLHDVMRSFYQRLGNIDFRGSMPTASIPYQIIYYPLITNAYDTASATINVWTNFPTDMPIGELLTSPRGRDLFCQNALLPADEFHLSSGSSRYGQVLCNVPGIGVDHREEVYLPKCRSPYFHIAGE